MHARDESKEYCKGQEICKNQPETETFFLFRSVLSSPLPACLLHIHNTYRSDIKAA